MKLARKNGSTSNILRAFLMDSASTTGGGKTGLTSASGGLIISTIADNEATATTYTAAGSTTETITTLGTFAAPTSTKCRFKEVDPTNHPGLYEIQIADARFAVSSAKSLIISIQATGVAPVYIEIDHGAQVDTVSVGGTAQTGRDLGASVLLSSGTGTGQVSLSSGLVTLAGTQTFNNTGTWTGNIVGTLSTLTTYTGNTPQTGDSYAIVNGASGLVAIKTDTAAILVDTGTTLDARIPAALGANGNMKADLRDYLGVAGPAADTAGYPKVTVKSGTGTGEISLSSGLVRISGTGIDDFWDEVVDGTTTGRQTAKLSNAANAGKLSGAATTTVVIRDPADAKDRITATCDADGNRSAITLDLT